METREGTSFLDFKRTSATEDFPTGFADYVRGYGDVYFWKKGNFHVVTRAADARDVLTNQAFSADRGSFFISRMPNLDLTLIQDFFGVVKKMMVMSDDRDHLKRRKFGATGADEKFLIAFREGVERTVDQILEELKDAREFDFVEKIAKKIPSTALAELYGIPTGEREDFLKWSNIMTGFFGGGPLYRNEDGLEVNEAARSLRAYFEHLMRERRKTSGKDYVSVCLKSQSELDLTDEEVVSQFIMMLVAGMATTTDQMSNIMFLLAQHPEIQEEVKQNPALLMPMIEECKRFDPAVTFIFRVAREDTRISHQPVKKGDVVFISTHAINRDLPLEERPQLMDIHRKGNHFAYGHGAHYCLGARLARLEMECLFGKLLSPGPLLRLHPEKRAVRDHYSLSFSGFKELPLLKS